MRAFKKILCLLMVGVLLAGCQQTPEKDSTPDKDTKPPVEVPKEPDFGGTLKISVDKPESLNPLINHEASVTQLMNLVYDGLYKKDEKGQMVPNLAANYQESANGKVATVTLKSDITWQDGTNFTAEDVLFTVDQIKALGEKTIYQPCVQNISYLKKISDYEIEINYIQPFANNFETLFFPIIPKHIEDLETQYVGTGMYKITKYLPMDEIQLTVSESYFGQKPYIENISAKIDRSPEAQLTSFKQDIIDLIYLEQMDWSKVADKEKVTSNEFVTNYYDYIGVNLEREELQNKEFRQALAYAIDKKNMIQNNLLGKGLKTDTIINPNIYQPSELKYTYQPEKSKEILETIGWDNTRGPIKLMVNGDNKFNVHVADKLVEYFNGVGINTEKDEVDAQTFMNQLQTGDFDLYLGGWMLSPITNYSFAFASDSAFNFGNYNDAKMDHLLETAFNASSVEQKDKAYEDLYEEIQEQLPYVSLYFRKNAVLTGKNVYGELNPTPNNIYNGIENLYIKTK